MICAIDCDLRTSYCVTDTGLARRGADPMEAVPDNLGPIDLILFEIASPVSFNRGASGHAAMYQLAKWAIWNTAWASRIDQSLRLAHTGTRMLVSPSDEWTRGFDLKTRHAMAKCKQPKKDLRECEAMIWFYRARPACWKPLPDYLATL
jgi:hypothetical protein